MTGKDLHELYKKFYQEEPSSGASYFRSRKAFDKLAKQLEESK